MLRLYYEENDSVEIRKVGVIGAGTMGNGLMCLPETAMT